MRRLSADEDSISTRDRGDFGYDAVSSYDPSHKIINNNIIYTILAR